MIDEQSIVISDCPADVVPAGCTVVVATDPATGDSVTGFYDPETGVTHIQRFERGIGDE